MKLVIVLVAIAILILTGTTVAERAVDCALTVYQLDTVSNEQVLLFGDTVQLVDGIPLSGFLVTFSMDLELTELDSVSADFMVHVITLGPPTKSYARSFSVEYGLPARIEHIKGKAETDYTLVVSPLGFREVDLSACEYNHRSEGVFTFGPSANMDIYYLRNSLGDFYYSTVKSVLEYGYRDFEAVCRFNLPGKYDVFLSPCYLPSIIWDRRFATAIDPTRSSAMVIFSLGLNSLDPFVVNHTALLRNWGYAPVFLTEGLAGYGSLPQFQMRRLVSEGRTIPLASLLVTKNYITADPLIADRTAASFAAFLVERNGLDRFRELYRAADDINLASRLAEIYDAPVDRLESEWLQWIDTVTIPAQEIVRQSELAEVLFDYQRMRDQARYLLDQAAARFDSVVALPLLKRASFFCGDFYDAVECQEQLVRYDSTSAAARMTLGTYRMMCGEYEAAHADLIAARTMNPNDPVAAFNVALSFLLRGDSTTAELILDSLVSVTHSGTASSEARLYLAEIMHHSPVKAKRERALVLYEQSAALLGPALQTQPSSPALHLWSGVALIGLGRLSEARDYLETALFLETRPFYISLMHLWRGKLADLTKERELAMAHYRLVIAGPAADYNQREARVLLEHPYKR